MPEMLEVFEVDGNVKRFKERTLGTAGWQDANAVALTGGTIGADVVISEEIAEGLTAAGSAQGDALALTAKHNVVSTAAASTGVRLPALAAGLVIVVKNNGANALNVYPASGETILGATQDAAISIATGGEWVMFIGGAAAWTRFMGAAD